MGLFSWLTDGGNIGLTAKSIAMHHERLGAFADVLAIYLNDFCSRQPGSRHYEKARLAVHMIQAGRIRNYRDLAILSLMVDAAPKNFFFDDVAEYFSDKIVKHLAGRGVSMDFITGDCLTY